MREPTEMLFPGSVNGHKGNVLSAQIQSAVRRYTGMQMHPHAFRHVAAKLHLQRRPNDYLPVSLLLGHKSVDTTRTYYCQLEMLSTARRYAEDVLGKRFS
jgi:integrase